MHTPVARLPLLPYAASGVQQARGGGLSQSRFGASGLDYGSALVHFFLFYLVIFKS